MKFVCRKCESFMSFEEVESVQSDSLGITFHCEQCQARFSMVTNAGETQMVKTLGVQLGGRSQDPKPMELTRSLNDTSPAPQKQSPTPLQKNTTDFKDSKGKCPFANLVAGMPAASALKEAAQSKPTEDSPSRLGPEVKMKWSKEAKARLKRVPDFVREFAKGHLPLESLKSVVFF